MTEFFQKVVDPDVLESEKASMRITRQETEEIVGAKAPQYTEEQTRLNASRVISRYKGFANVVVAMEMDLTQADGQTAAWVGHELAEAMKVTREDGKWLFHSWVRDAMRTQRDKAFALAKTKADASTIQLFEKFRENLRLAEEILDGITRVQKGAHPGVVQSARRKFDYANNTRFCGWALAAIERMLDGSNNPVADLLKTDPELAGVVMAAPQNRRAMPLIEAMKARVENRLLSLEKKIEERRAYKKFKKLGRQAANDSNYQGPNKRHK